MDPSTGKRQRTDATVYEAWREALTEISAEEGATPFEYMPARCITDTWIRLTSTSQRYVLRSTLQSIHDFCVSSRPDWPDATPKLAIASESLAPMATTSMSSTPARTQMLLVAARGSREAQSGTDGGDVDIDEEFTSILSRFRTGRASLDITLQKANQTNTLKAEVSMDELVYELKIYR